MSVVLTYFLHRIYTLIMKTLPLKKRKCISLKHKYKYINRSFLFCFHIYKISTYLAYFTGSCNLMEFGHHQRWTLRTRLERVTMDIRTEGLKPRWKQVRYVLYVSC